MLADVSGAKGVTVDVQAALAARRAVNGGMGGSEGEGVMVHVGVSLGIGMGVQVGEGADSSGGGATSNSRNPVQ
jgi:hypothetical protein